MINWDFIIYIIAFLVFFFALPYLFDWIMYKIKGSRCSTCPYRCRHFEKCEERKKK